MQITNETRRSVMQLAWEMFRDTVTAGETRTFADALASAWRFTKRMAAAAAKFMATAKNGRIEMRSPIARSAVGRRYGAAAYLGGRSSHAYLAARAGR